MIPHRRLALQLTPLLDLLLIVIFAQYMEVTIVARQESERIAQQRRDLTQENDELRSQMDEWTAERSQIDRQEQQQREQIGQLVRELFHIPETVVSRIVQPRGQNPGGLSPAEIADLQSRIQQLATSSGETIIDHLLTFNEMRKQFDIWDVYLNERGELRVSLGPERQLLKTAVIETPEQFIEAILKIRRQFPPSRPTVLILCRYGDCRLVHKLSMIRGLPAIAERLRADEQRQTDFEYAVFGYRPQPALD